MAYGRYFSFTTGSLAAGTDLIAEAETLTGISNIIAKKLTLVCSGSLSLNINGLAGSTLYLDQDSLYRLALDDGDVLISSLVTVEGATSASPVFVSMIF